MMEEVEPTIRLSNGREVLQCVAYSIRRLQADGHHVRVVDGTVIIDPPISEAWRECLELQHLDVADILEEG